MSKNTITDDEGLAGLIENLTDRIIDLERSAQLKNSRVESSLDPELAFLWISNGEKLAPFDTTYWEKQNDAVTITSATFITVWRSRLRVLYTPDVSFSFVATSGVATTAEIKVKFFGPVETDTVSVAAATQKTINVKWRHGVTIGGGPVDIEIQARRVTGANNVNVFAPTTCTHMGNENILSGGIEAV